MKLTFWQMEMIPWYVFAAYWVVTWLRVKRTKTAETSWQRGITVVLMIAAFVLLFENEYSMGPLDRRFLRADERIGWAGILLTGVGVTVAIWARFYLGQYWSSRVTLKEGHQLIRSGPYRFVRHPIYTGMLLATIGTALVLGEWRGVLGIAVMLVAHSLKAVREEALLTTEFGEEYASYRRSTGFLFPGL